MARRVVASCATLPDECLVEVFRSLPLAELFSAARVCRRWALAALDPSLWASTRFSSMDSRALLVGHFTPLSPTRVDHTGSWTHCERKLGRLRLMCRVVDLDYVEAGEGVSYRLLRSISCLQQLSHPTIVPLVLVNVDVPRNSLSLFYGDVGVPLETVLKERSTLPMDEARCVVRQVLAALAHCHAQGITHRNLKPKYILLDEAVGTEGGALPGERWHVRLSDFNSVRWLLAPAAEGAEGGAASGAEPALEAVGPLYGARHVLGASSPTVVTLPYRAPEILLGCAHYTTAIDLWAVGCVFAEMMTGTMLFVGDSDIGQLFKIFSLLGTPGSSESWPRAALLPFFNTAFPRMRPKPWEDHPQLAELAAHPLAAGLLRRMLDLDPSARISAAAALEHPFLTPDDPTAGDKTPPPPPRARFHASPAANSGGRRSGGLFGTPSGASGGRDDGWVWESWRRRESERAVALRLESGTAVWRAVGLAADEAREAAALWLQGAACEFCRSDRTVHLAVRLLDHYLALAPDDVKRPLAADAHNSVAAVDSKRVRVSTAAALLLACKFQEVETHTVEQLAAYCKLEHSVAELLEAELRICIALSFDLAFPTAVDCLFCVLGRLAWPSNFAAHRGASKQSAMLAQLLCDLALLSPAAAAIRPSLLASSALCLAVAALRLGRWADGSPRIATTALSYWTPTMAQVTGYSAEELRQPIALLQEQHEAVYRELGSLSPPQLATYADAARGADTGSSKRRWAPLAIKFRSQRFLNVLAVPPFAPHGASSLAVRMVIEDSAINSKDGSAFSAPLE